MTEILKNDDARADLDGMLHDYFQAEMPHPWPAFQAPRVKAPVSFWSRYSGRIALAACITLLAAGYLTLAGYFPRNQSGTGVMEVNRNIGEHKKEGTTSVPNAHSDEPMPAPNP